MNKELEALSNLIRLNRYDEKVSFNTGITFGEAMDNYDLIKTTLKRNEPMEVEIGTLKHFKFPICPNCKGELNEYYKNKYCKDCGQRLDWSKE